MTIYCQIEFTGQHNQFYEKFEVRHQISKILRLIWDTKEHREAFKTEAVKEDFVRFVNYLLNDTTFMLDESLSKLKQIHDLQQEMADKATWDAQTEEQRKDKEKLFKAAEGQATSNLVYAYESLSLFKTLTGEAPVPFLRGEIVDRLTSSLDYNLNILAGPQCQELRVQDKEKYRFRPRELLGDIMQIIMNLADKQAYIMSTAKDGRSYSRALFENAIRIASRTGMKTEQQLQVLRRMVEQIEALRAAEAEEEEMGETPDEYLDPLTAENMEDPVILPSSKNVLDFNTIKQHLLTVQQDPFNRTPLKLEELVRDDKLREEIVAWRAKRRQDRLDRISGAQMEVDAPPPVEAPDPLAE
jgi:ubiquitin conjugation factor E4 B